MAVIGELQRHSNALRWLVTLKGHGEVPGEIQDAAAEAYERLEALRRKFYLPEAIERSVAAAWAPTDGVGPA
jgi:hypothetical protein